MSTTPMKDWLLRDTNNYIHGPFTRDEILAQIRSEKLRSKTEISLTTTYWFTLDEKRELYKFFPELGSASKQAGSDEATATMTRSEIPSATQLDAMEKGGDQTTLISGFPGKKNPAPEVEKAAAPVGEWLSNEYAEEFGVDFGDSLAMETEAPVAQSEAPAKEAAPSPMDAVRTHMSSVPAGHVQSPKKITAFRPTDDEPTVSDVIIDRAALSRYDDTADYRRRILIIGSITFILIALLAAVIYFFESNRIQTNSLDGDTSSSSVVKDGLNSKQDRLRAALFLRDIKMFEATLASMELTQRTDLTYILSSAILKGSFKYDSEGAVSILEASRSLAATNQKMVAEFENLAGVYSLATNVDAASEHFKLAYERNPSEQNFQYNLALAKFLSADYSAAAKLLWSKNPDPAQVSSYDYFLLQGLILEDGQEVPNPEAATYFAKALALFPQGYEARLLLAVHKLRVAGLQDARSDFEDFLYRVPNLEQPEWVENYRLAKNSKLLKRCLEIIRASQSATRSANARAEPLLLAIDAILTTELGDSREAEKILDRAMHLAPADSQLLISMAYLKFKEQSYDEVVDLLKDRSKESQENFPFLKLSGYAYVHMGRRALAGQILAQAVQLGPDHSELVSMLGDVHANGGATKNSNELYQKALNLNARDARALAGVIKSGHPELMQRSPYRELIPF